MTEPLASAKDTSEIPLGDPTTPSSNTSSEERDRIAHETEIRDLNERFLEALGGLGTGVEPASEKLLMSCITQPISLKIWDRDAYGFCKQKYNLILPFMEGVKDKESVKESFTKLHEGARQRGVKFQSTLYEFMREIMGMIGMRPLTLAPLTIAALASPMNGIAAPRANEVLIFMKGVMLQNDGELDDYFLSTGKGVIPRQNLDQAVNSLSPGLRRLNPNLDEQAETNWMTTLTHLTKYLMYTTRPRREFKKALETFTGTRQESGETVSDYLIQKQRAWDEVNRIAR